MTNKLLNLSFLFVLYFSFMAVGCSAQTEEQALASLREMTKDGKLPPESVVADIESRFANKKSGALAKLLRARIKFENKDYAGAAAVLNSDVFKKRTKLADHALWLRGKALQGAGNHAEALKVLDELLREHPESVRTRDAKLLWATSAIAAGRAVEVPPMLVELVESDNLEAMMLTAKAYEAQGSISESKVYYMRVIAYGLGSKLADEAKARATADGSVLAEPDEFSHAGLSPGWEVVALRQADYLLRTKNYQRAARVYDRVYEDAYRSMTATNHVNRVTALSNIGRMAEAQNAFNSLPVSAKEREAAYRELVLGYSKARMWPQARSTMDAMRSSFPNGALVPRTLIDAGLAARDAKNRTDEGYFLNTAVTAYPNAIEVAQAQFEAAWFQHDGKNFALSSQMFIEHLARYADKDTTNRGKAGYWAARDSERANKTAEACALYDAVIYRYSANWYGYLAASRFAAMKAQGKCSSTTAPNQTVAKAVANLKTVTVAAETAREKELERAEKSDELSTIGLFDWAIDELTEAKRTANNSPKINLALARHYRFKGDNTNALLALAKSYPDYAQMFPEEMDREVWSIFYPLTNWSEIKYWANARGLDPYQVAGLIRQESVFDPRARSSANAHGLMQLLVPTANSMAKKYVSKTSMVTPTLLYEPPLNIELGTAYMKDQFAKFGRIEYVAVAYNAGPGRVPQWRATLPAEIDEFVEAIPFKETRGYVQGVVRNSAQYRRLYDDNGNFRSNVGTKPLRGEIDSKPREQFVAEFPEVVIDDNGSE